MTTSPVRVGVSFDGFVTTGEAIALAQRAVEMGARSLWVAEHLGYREAIARGYDDILVLYADTPLIEASTLEAMRTELASGVEVVALGFEAADPAGYGRFIERNGRLIAIREHKDASAEERASRLCNAGPIAPAPPNSSAAMTQRVGLHRAKMTSATAINPCPEDRP